MIYDKKNKNYPDCLSNIRNWKIKLARVPSLTKIAKKKENAERHSKPKYCLPKIFLMPLIGFDIYPFKF
jgi:hypothetical protein